MLHLGVAISETENQQESPKNNQHLKAIQGEKIFVHPALGTSKVQNILTNIKDNAFTLKLKWILTNWF